MYADNITDSMRAALNETNRRRLQQAYNDEHGIDPQTIRKAVTDILLVLRGQEEGAPVPEKLSSKEFELMSKRAGIWLSFRG